MKGIAEVAELGSLDNTRIASLAGLASHPYDSGPMRGQRHIQGGRKKVRRALYMAVVRSVSINPILSTFDRGLLKRGKPFKVAITAVMRKMLCVLNRLIADPNFQPCQLTRLLSVGQRSLRGARPRMICHSRQARR